MYPRGTYPDLHFAEEEGQASRDISKKLGEEIFEAGRRF